MGFKAFTSTFKQGLVADLKERTVDSHRVRAGIDGRMFCPKCGSDHLVKKVSLVGEFLKCMKCKKVSQVAKVAS